MIVAKVGGSSLTCPELGSRLHRWITSQSEPVLLIPGGGAMADIVRNWDEIHQLGDETSHWLAIESMRLTGLLLQRLLEGAVLSSTGSDQAPLLILDVAHYFRSFDDTPHTWAVTSDSLAARVACHLKASLLVLFKSTELPERLDWQAASREGLVDGYFPTAIQWLDCPIRWVNLWTY